MKVKKKMHRGYESPSFRLQRRRKYGARYILIDGVPRIYNKTRPNYLDRTRLRDRQKIA
jgi:hypothetical protein